MLNIISLGLFDKKDISIKGIDACKKCDYLYIERYTNYFGSSAKELEGFIGKNIKELKREDLENNSKEIIEKAKRFTIGVLVPGDCFSATTHISLLVEAKKEKIRVNVVHGSSIFTAIGETGLNLYNLGRVTTIPFDNKDIKSPIEVFRNNQKLGMHTLFLLDVKESRYMNIKDGLKYLIENKISGDMLCVGCAGLGSENKEIKFGTVSSMLKKEFNVYPQCFVITGKLHFAEEEALSFFRVS